MTIRNDPTLIAAARELRDRWLGEVNSGRYLPETQGKYEVSCRLPAAPPQAVQVRLIQAA